MCAMWLGVFDLLARRVGYEISDDGVDWEAMFNSFKTTGFQATNLGLAIEKINEMLRWRLSDDPVTAETDDEARPHERYFLHCTPH